MNVPTNDEDLRRAFEELQKKMFVGYDSKDLARKVANYFSHGVLKVTNYVQNTELFFASNPFFYDRNGFFWLWDFNKSCWEIVDETDIMNKIEMQLKLSGETITGGVKANYLEAFRRVGRKHIPQPAPKKWLQFKDKAFSIESKNTYLVTPDYFFTNPIPWELGNCAEVPTIDKLFSDWVGEEKKHLLYELIAYCCYTDYPLHYIFCLIGCGRNGKSQFQALLTRFLGKENICSTELETILESRFETFKLYRKLVCSLGETNFGMLTKTSILKRLTGQDLIGFEAKNKMPFDDYSYAKIIISSNSLPTSEDTSEGFYRRWIILPFENEFPEGKPIINTIPEQEFKNLAFKVTQILPALLEAGSFMGIKSIEGRKNDYILASNPLPLFLEKFAITGDIAFYTSYNELYAIYSRYLTKIKKRVVSRKEFAKALENEGYFSQRTTKYSDKGEQIRDYWVDCVFLKRDILAKEGLLSGKSASAQQTQQTNDFLLHSAKLGFGVEKRWFTGFVGQENTTTQSLEPPTTRDSGIIPTETILSKDINETNPFQNITIPSYGTIHSKTDIINIINKLITDNRRDNVDIIERVIGKECLLKLRELGEVYEYPSGTLHLIN